MTTKPRFGFALAYVTDIQAAKRFYVDVLGLEVQREALVFVQFPNFAIASDESISGTGETLGQRASGDAGRVWPRSRNWPARRSARSSVSSECSSASTTSSASIRVDDQVDHERVRSQARQDQVRGVCAPTSGGSAR